MNRNKAIEILRKQKEKMNGLNPDNYYVWHTHNMSYISSFFGVDSSEYKFLFNFHFYYSYENPLPEFKKSLINMATFLDNCIEKIDNVGLPKKEWKHILITTHPVVFWTVFLALLGGFFWLGQVTANKSDNASGNKTEQKNNNSHKNPTFDSDSTGTKDSL